MIIIIKINKVLITSYFNTYFLMLTEYDLIQIRVIYYGQM